MKPRINVITQLLEILLVEDCIQYGVLVRQVYYYNNVNTKTIYYSYWMKFNRIDIDMI